MTIADRIKAWRTHAGLRAVDLARVCEVSDAAVSQWEGGVTTPTTANIAKIASGCGISMSLFWSDPPRARKRSA